MGSPFFQNALSSSGLGTHNWEYIAKALLPAYCFALPYPRSFKRAKKTRFAAGSSLIFLVSHVCGGGGGCSTRGDSVFGSCTSWCAVVGF